MRKIAPLRRRYRSGMHWEVRLEPYDLVAVRFSDPSAQFSNPQVTWDVGRGHAGLRRFAASAPGPPRWQSAAVGCAGQSRFRGRSDRRRSDPRLVRHVGPWY